MQLQFCNWYSIAALRLKASVKAVSWRISVFPTLRTSIPSVAIPTPNSGCSLIPCSMISAIDKDIEQMQLYKFYKIYIVYNYLAI